MIINREYIREWIGKGEAVSDIFKSLFRDYSDLGGYRVFFTPVDSVEVLCAKCAKRTFIMDRKDIAADCDSEWDYIPTCDECGIELLPDHLTDEGCISVCGQASIEVFYIDEVEAVEPGSVFEEMAGGPGWYYWYCQPGCLPDSEPNGPFKTEEEAYRDAAEDYMDSQY